MSAYCENTVDCRRKIVLSYFGEEFNEENCNPKCDNCNNRSSSVMKDVSKQGLEILKIVEELEKKQKKKLFIKLKLLV